MTRLALAALPLGGPLPIIQPLFPTSCNNSETATPVKSDIIARYWSAMGSDSDRLSLDYLLAAALEKPITSKKL